jgi:hypothetical protein
MIWAAPTLASTSTVTRIPRTTGGEGRGVQSYGSTLYSASIACSSSVRGRMGRTLAHIGMFLLLGGAMQAQAPALSAILQQAKATREAAFAVLQGTPEYKAYDAALRTERAIEQRIAAEAKPVEPPK